MAKYVRKHKSTTDDELGAPKRNPSKTFARRIKKQLGEITPDEHFAESFTELKYVGGKERLTHDAEILRLEWAIKYSNMPPYRWLQEVKDYSEGQAQAIVNHGGGLEEWQREKERVLDRMTESVVKRHIDQMAEVQETHVKSSKLGLARAVQMLTEGGRHLVSPKTGLKKLSEDGRPIVMPLTPKELLTCMGTIEKAQTIYRRAMGLPNDEGGLAQIIDKIQASNVTQNIQNNITIHESPKESEAEVMARTMTEEQIEAFVEFRREEKARRLNEGKQ